MMHNLKSPETKAICCCKWVLNQNLATNAKPHINCSIFATTHRLCFGCGRGEPSSFGHWHLYISTYLHLGILRSGLHRLSSGFQRLSARFQWLSCSLSSNFQRFPSGFQPVGGNGFQLAAAQWATPGGESLGGVDGEESIGLASCMCFVGVLGMF